MDDEPLEPDLVRDLKALADVGRLRILGRLAVGPATLAELSAATRLTPSRVTHDLGLLEQAGLVAIISDRWAMRPEGVMAIGRRLHALEAAGSPDAAAAPDTALAPEDAKTLRAFVVDGRLASIPAQERKRAVILRWVLERCFADDRAYPEKEVNERLREVNDDTASLRRYLVDAGLMDREAGVYVRRPSRDDRPGV